jgi:phospholipid/cholesterol/gamma-HCH transport system substrate-binding protein
VSRSLSRWQAVFLGLVVLAGLGLAGTGLFAIGSGGWWGKPSFTLEVSFPDVRGLEKGTRVRIQGIDAGEVVDLRSPRKRGEPVVAVLRLKEEQRYLIGPNAKVQILSEGLIGGKVLEITPSDEDGEPVADGARLKATATRELTDVVSDTADTIKDIREGKGTLGKLASDPAVHDALLELLQQGKTTANSMSQVSDAVHRLPLVGKYVEVPEELLDRPNCQRDRRWFAESDLFEPGRAVLTAGGRQHLDQIAPWLEGMKHKGSEVVVVSFADPQSPSSGNPRILTRQQSDAVCDYLTKQHSIQKMGWFSSRKVTSLGQGTNPSPVSERSPLPPARVEIIVFVPQGNS